MNDETPLNTVTCTVLLEGLRDYANRTVWQEFCTRYQPMLRRYGRRMGLSEADAEDAAQQTLIAFGEAYQAGKYDPLKGRLRVWLFGIARNQIRNLQRRGAGRREVQVADASDATAFMGQVAGDDVFEQAWEEEWQNAVLRQCLTEVASEMDERTVQAFELFAWEGLPAKEVAERLEMTPNAVLSPSIA
jgi:RNA polymerase sigma-70 factor (ECF subfamily)